MAIVQISKIQQRSGNLVDLPQLDEAELGFASDEKLLYVGVEDPPENVEVLTSYSNISFSQLEGSYGNLEIEPSTAEDGQVLTFDGNNWVNRGGDSGGLINLGDVGNLKIYGGGIDYVLTTDGIGNLSWTAKGTIVAFIENVSQANPGVVTTTQDNFLTEGAEITITDPKGMTDLAGGVYYANILTSNTFALYADTGLTTTVDTSGFSEYSYTSVTATTSGTNDITVGDATLFSVNDAVRFIGTTFGGITANVTYYVLTASGTTLTISETSGGSELPLTTASGTCNVYATGGRIVSQLSGEGSGTAAEGSNLSVQFNHNNLLDGDPDFTWNYITNTLTVTGNANATNVNATNVIASNITGTLTTTSNAQPNLTSFGNATQVTVSGNLNPNANITYSLGNSTNRWTDVYITNLVIGTGNITSNASGIFINSLGGLINGNSNILMAANGNINMSVAGNANIFSVTGTGANIAGYANISGNANVGNIGATNGVFTANVTAGNVFANSGLVSANLLAGTLITAAQPNVTSLGTLTGLDVNGTITAVDITANTGVITGNGSGLSALNASNITTGTLAQARLANSSLTINGITIALGASGTITSTAAQSHSNGSYITGGSYNGGTAITWAVDAVSSSTADKIVARDSNGSFSANVITAANFVGNGAGLTSITGANVTGQVANALVAGTVYTAAQPNITSVGTLTSLTVSGPTSVTGNSALTATNITTGANTTLGYLTGNWTLTTGSRLAATYADLAEYYAADKNYPAGTVLEFGGDKEVTLAGIESNKLAGVVSSEPAYVMNGNIQTEHPVIIALIGRVPVRAIGFVHKGDMMISAGNGLAKATILTPKIGTVIGKAISSKSNDDEGIVEVMVGRI